MKNKDLQLLIPADISEKLDLKDNDKAILSIRNNKLIVQFQENQLHTVRNSFIWPIIIALITSIGFYIYCISQNIESIKMAGNSSLATAIIMLGAIIGTILFTFSLSLIGKIRTMNLQKMCTGEIFQLSLFLSH